MRDAARSSYGPRRERGKLPRLAMPSGRCLIIDDVSAALGAMTELGRSVVGESSGVVRDTVRQLAERRGWAVVSHGPFAAWALKIAQQHDHPWLILDPLFPLATLSRSDLRFARTTRGLSSLEATAGEAIGSALASLPRGPIGVIDDAAASGTTLRHVSAACARLGFAVTHILLCAATRIARESTMRSMRSVTLSEYMPIDDWQVAHLRDGCCFLPYSGRRADQHPIRLDDGSLIEVRCHGWRISCRR